MGRGRSAATGSLADPSTTTECDLPAGLFNTQRCLQSKRQSPTSLTIQGHTTHMSPDFAILQLQRCRREGLRSESLQRLCLPWTASERTQSAPQTTWCRRKRCEPSTNKRPRTPRPQASFPPAEGQSAREVDHSEGTAAV